MSFASLQDLKGKVMMITNDKNLFKVPETVTAVEKTFGNPSAKSVQFPIIHVKLITLYQLFFTHSSHICFSSPKLKS